MLYEKLQDRLTIEGSIEKWTSFKETVSETAKEVLGVKTRTHKDWFDENDEKIKEAIHAKNKSYIQWLNDPSSVSKHEKFKALQAKIFEQCRTSGGGTKQLKSNTTLTLTMPRNFSAH